MTCSREPHALDIIEIVDDALVGPSAVDLVSGITGGCGTAVGTREPVKGKGWLASIQQKACDSR